MQFSYHHRLKSKASFNFIFEQPKKVGQKFFTALYRLNRENRTRLGIIIAKRNAPSAVARNRIKRIIRESFRHQYDNLPTVDIIVIAKLRCDKLSNPFLREEIEKLWAKLRM